MASTVTPTRVQSITDYPHCKVDFPSQRFTALKNVVLASVIFGLYYYMFACCLK